MSKRAILVVCIVLAGVVALVAYERYRTYTHFNSGEVTAMESRSAAVSPEADAVQQAPARTPAKKEPAGHPLDEPAAETPGDTADTAAATDAPNSGTSNGTAAVTGAGRFQVYRQGDLTWRVDTESGNTCVLFATDDEWRNPRVLRRACESR